MGHTEQKTWTNEGQGAICQQGKEMLTGFLLFFFSFITLLSKKKKNCLLQKLFHTLTGKKLCVKETKLLVNIPSAFALSPTHPKD